MHDRVKVKTSGKEGKVIAIYDTTLYIHHDGDETEYLVDFGDGTAAVTLVEKVLELSSEKNMCQCGLSYARSGGKHSSWCYMAAFED
jgi:hypothetical protein